MRWRTDVSSGGLRAEVGHAGDRFRSYIPRIVGSPADLQMLVFFQLVRDNQGVHREARFWVRARENMAASWLHWIVGAHEAEIMTAAAPAAF
jgi:hypothetical protein